MTGLYTIGHSNHSMDRFLDLLAPYGIEYLIDVRSVPYSKYAEQFNREYLSNTLRKQDIRYIFMGSRMGARPADPSLYSEDGYLDFERVRSSDGFICGINNIVKGLKRGCHVVLMCTEKDPFDCHRAILISRAFEEKGVQARHILADGSIQMQQTLNNRLLQHYFPNRNQINIFELSYFTNEQEYLCEAYRQRNKDIFITL